MAAAALTVPFGQQHVGFDIGELMKAIAARLLLILAATPAWALTPIVHTDVVPFQRIEYGTSFDFGVVAFSKAGIDRVEFAISGQGYSGGKKTTSAMTLNTRVASDSPGITRPGVWEYHVTISAREFNSNGMITVTPIINGPERSCDC